MVKENVFHLLVGADVLQFKLLEDELAIPPHFFDRDGLAAIRVHLPKEGHQRVIFQGRGRPHVFHECHCEHLSHLGLELELADRSSMNATVSI